jgi:hypothetical protein
MLKLKWDRLYWLMLACVLLHLWELANGIETSGLLGTRA